MLRKQDGSSFLLTIEKFFTEKWRTRRKVIFNGNIKVMALPVISFRYYLCELRALCERQKFVRHSLFFI